MILNINYHPIAKGLKTYFYYDQDNTQVQLTSTLTDHKNTRTRYISKQTIQAPNIVQTISLNIAEFGNEQVEVIKMTRVLP